MERGKIRKLNKELSEELSQMQDKFIYEAENNTEKYLDAYKNLPSSISSHYICSDLVKETFEDYAKGVENRKKYAEVVHNSAAVLANEVFTRMVNDKKIKRCIFLSGIPGAGKSFLVQSLAVAGAIGDDTIIYEGDITTPSIYEKMQMAVDNDVAIDILIVNPTLYLAQQNAIARHFEIGRGASSETMARIMSKIPGALEEIKSRFSIASLGIYNKETNYDIKCVTGFENIEMLNHGSYDEILLQLLNYRKEILCEMAKTKEEEEYEPTRK